MRLVISKNKTELKELSDYQPPDAPLRQPSELEILQDALIEKNIIQKTDIDAAEIKMKAKIVAKRNAKAKAK